MLPNHYCTTSVCVPQFPTQASDEVTSKRKGGGGAWRAYQRLCGATCAGLPNNGAMAAAYHKMKQENGPDFAFLRSLGQSCTAAARATATTKHSLVLAGKALLRRKKQLSITALWESMQGKSVAETAVAVLEQSKLRGKGVDHALSVASALHRLDTQAKNNKSHASLEKLDAWQKTEGRERLNALCEVYPSLRECDLVPVPHPELTMFELDVNACSDRAKLVAAHATENSHHPLGKSLSTFWQGVHELQEPKEETRHAGEAKSDCLKAGRCLCSPMGKHLKRLLGKFHSLLKSQCTGPSKALLTTGKIVLHIANVAGMPDWNAHQEGQLHYVFGVAMMYYKPYRATLEQLLPTSFAELGIVVPNPDLRYVQVTALVSVVVQQGKKHATAVFLEEYAALEMLDLTQSWHMRMYKLLETSTPVADMRPVHLAVTPAGEAQQLWPPERKARSLNTHVGWDVMVASLLSTPIEDEESDAIADEEEDDDEDDEDGIILGTLVTEHEAVQDMIVLRELQAESLLEVAAHAPSHPVLAEGSVGASMPRVYLGREAAVATVVVEGVGKIAYHSSKRAFEGRCFRHQQCTMSKSCIRTKRCNGRPLGLMLSWLLSDLDEVVHKDKLYLRGFLTLERRQAARATLESLEGSAALLGLEHAHEEGEPSEPVSLQGLL
eukprot:6492740-Amphidinium_carterae.2